MPQLALLRARFYVDEPVAVAITAGVIGAIVSMRGAEPYARQYARENRETWRVFLGAS